MKLKFSLLILALSFFAEGFSQDDKAIKILNDLSAKTKAYNNFSADFTMNLVDQQSDIDLKRNGTIKVSGNKYRVQLDKDVIIGDGDTRWTYQAESNEVYVDYEAEEEDSGLNPSKLFTIWESGFKQLHAGKVSHSGRQLDQITLHPVKAAETNYHTVKVFVDVDKMELVRVEVMGKEGDKYTYELLKFKSNDTMGADTFAFNKSNFPGVEVIDLR